jgi:O-Antigen ligase
MNTTSVRPLSADRVKSGPWTLLTVALLAFFSAAATLFWPTFGLVLAALAVVFALALRAPSYAFVFVVLLFGFEGSIKIRFWLEGTPFSSGGSAVGAFLIDVAFLVAVAASLRTERRRELAHLWRAIDRWTRAGLALLAAWLVLSVIQIPLSTSVATGLHGFRLTQLYVLAVLPGATLLAARARRDWVLRALLGALTIVAAYAAVRTVVGPAASERSFALSHPVASVAADNVIRNIGSFSGATGLVSFMIPAAVLGFLLGLLRPRYRLLSWGLFALAVIALLGTYIRAGILAVGFGIVISIVLVYWRGGRSLREHKRLALLAVLLLVLAAGATALAFAQSPSLSRRATNIVHPLRDPSVKIRLHALRNAAHVVRNHPFGTGLGTFRVSDSSYLTITREQGVLGGTLFTLGIASLLIGLARGVRRRSGFSRSLGTATLGALFAVAAFWLVWDNIQQPGKVLVWGLVGVALAAAWGPALEPDEAEAGGVIPAIRSGWNRFRASRPSLVAVSAVLIASLVLLALALAIPRKEHFEAARVITVAPRGASRPTGEVGYLETLLASFRRAVSTGFGTRTYNPTISDSSLLSGIRLVRGTSPNTMAVVDSASTPERAQFVVNQTARALVVQNKLDIDPAYALDLHSAAGRPPLHDSVDRLVIRLPGVFPPRPALVWAAGAAALAGLLLLTSLAILRRTAGRPT